MLQAASRDGTELRVVSPRLVRTCRGAGIQATKSYTRYATGTVSLSQCAIAKICHETHADVEEDRAEVLDANVLVPIPKTVNPDSYGYATGTVSPFLL